MGIPDHLTCLLRNLYAGQKITVTTGHETTDWFHIGKGVRQGCTLSPYLLNLYTEYIMRNAGLNEAQAGIKIAGRSISRRTDHLICLLRNLYAGQEATGRTGHGTTRFQIGKGICQGFILSPYLFN